MRKLLVIGITILVVALGALLGVTVAHAAPLPAENPPSKICWCI